MIKRIFIASAAFALTTGIAFANGTPYIGASLGEATNTTSNSGPTFRGVPLTVNVGYGALVSQNLYLGGELFGVLGTASIDDHGLKSTYGYGLSVIPGVMLGDHTMAFLRAGAVRSYFKPSSAPSHNVTGGQLGVGMQMGLTQNLDLRGEYVFTAYNSLRGTGSPRQDAFNLGVVYKFD